MTERGKAALQRKRAQGPEYEAKDTGAQETDLYSLAQADSLSERQRYNSAADERVNTTMAVESTEERE